MKLQMLKRALISYVTNSIKLVWSALAYPLTVPSGKNGYVNAYRIYGNTVQNGTPSHISPKEIVSAGDIVSAKKYKIPVVASKNNQSSITTDIYLSEPLRSIEYNNKMYKDYIDSDKGAVVKYTFEEVYDGTEDWSLVATSRFAKRITTARTVICSHYETVGSQGTDRTVVANYSSRVFIEDSRFATVAEFKAYLAEQANAGTPVTAVFLDYNAWKSGPKETNTVLPTLPQFKGATTYETDTQIKPSGIEVEYYG